MSLLKRLFSVGKKSLPNEWIASFDTGIMAYGREDYITAYQSFYKLAEVGHAISQMYVGVMYKSGQGVKKDYKKSFDWMKKSAKQGLLQAQYNLAVMYDNGEGTQQDQSEAANWYRKSAEQGEVFAQYRLACMLGQGVGISKNTKEAAKYLRLAAEQGHDSAQYNLALLYSDGNGVKQNYAEAARWYKQAAEQGHINSQFNLGVCYRDGCGVKQNNQEAVRWWRKAAENGSKGAQYSLGAFYDTGKGVEQNYNEAAHWYRKAAVQGHSTAQFYLGAMYKKGEGVPLDLKEAYAWFLVASANGCDDATEQLDSLAYNMPTYQLELGKSLGKEYLKKYKKSLEKHEEDNTSKVKFNSKITTPSNKLKQEAVKDLSSAKRHQEDRGHVTAEKLDTTKQSNLVRSQSRHYLISENEQDKSLSLKKRKISDPTFFHVVGVSHPNSDGSSRQNILSTLDIGEKLRIEPEPTNPYDQNALRVISKYGQIGYVPRILTSTLKEFLATEMHVDIYSKGRAGNGLLGCKVRISHDSLDSNAKSFSDAEIDDNHGSYSDVEMESIINDNYDDGGRNDCDDSDNGYDGLESYWHEYHKHD